MVKDWKTTIGGLIAALGLGLQAFGIPTEVGNAVAVIGVFILGLFAKQT